jgi:5-methylcytosine-specific restriction endonuclease McrA
MHALYRRQRGRCLYCANPLRGKYQIDHKVPVSRGGSSWPENLALACGGCNRSKRNRTAEEFLAQRGDG